MNEFIHNHTLLSNKLLKIQILNVGSFEYKSVDILHWRGLYTGVYKILCSPYASLNFFFTDLGNPVSPNYQCSKSQLEPPGLPGSTYFRAKCVTKEASDSCQMLEII